MKSLHYLVVAAGVAAAATSLGEEKVTRTEKNVTRTESQDGSTRVTSTVSTTVNTYVDHVRTAYSSLGLPESTVDRLIELERRLYQAYVAGDWTTVRQTRIEIRRLLTPDQVTRVYSHFQSHPLSADIAPIATYTWIPQDQFETHVIQNQSGRIEPGVLSVPGVSSSATIRSGSTGVDVNAAPSTSRTGTDVNVGRTEIRSGTSGTSSDTDASGAATGATHSGSTSGVSGSTTLDTNASGATGSTSGMSGSSSTGATGSTGSTSGAGSTGSTSGAGTSGASGSSGSSGSGAGSSGSSSGSSQ